MGTLFLDPHLPKHSLDCYYKMVIQSIARDANMAIEHDEGSRLSAGSDPSSASAAALKIVNFFPVKTREDENQLVPVLNIFLLETDKM